MNRDLTVGNAGKVLIGFTVPMFISVIFQQLYSISDSIIAGRYAGEDALAAIGASYPITMIFMAVAIGCQIGCSVIISHTFGNKDYKRTRTCISTALISGLILSIILTVVGVGLSTVFMKLINTPENIFPDAEAYLKIYTAGFVFVFMYNISTGIFNSLGDSKTPLYLLILSSLGNVALDCLFVIGKGMGVKGAALGTLITQGAACILALLILLVRIRKLADRAGSRLFDFTELKRIMSIAVPSVLQQSFISIGNLFVQSIVNDFGSSVIAGYSAAIKLNTFLLTSLTTVGNGVSSFTAQNIGAGKSERIKKGVGYGVVFVLIISAVFFLTYNIFGTQLLSLFMNEESTQLALDTGRNFLKIVTPFYFTICLKLVFDGVLRGSESMKYFMIATLVDLVLRVVLAYIFSPIWQETGVWMAWPLSWVIGAVLSFCFYKKGVWRRTAD